jgi:hypothetical protein
LTAASMSAAVGRMVVSRMVMEGEASVIAPGY